ncbi:cytochrome c oxidase subunit 4 [Blastomyces dermatitidis ER-3]|uniref:Cytochrome c oxidase polypeptide V n=3 Tax=Blastomyces TaxID=229219 RepID=A0A179USM6_BLAGS|nr:cytochrome c oxidase subunit 4 [Blastomyces gilchristii SLH14081]XP_045277203.1 cytochrome c oxidase subunit 4 [Blastomyces dermatitidis ER-3]EGE83922.1 cytochrome c oxidase subunit 4 [Blastomyces dermatitidis ATCC 18188]EQL28374.1 cytochrome c oxidase subunit 4 [Blastomyces dermatitidis ATCC 26199]EEQ90475.1 cytochrome c oxidase subunit 4 [Blastomyces dermatitidis ER-3]OAT10198.1 cytochrome c oxidase subunit 4 [Blastomyces gilchristii SLH14081]
MSFRTALPRSLASVARSTATTARAYRQSPSSQTIGACLYSYRRSSNCSMANKSQQTRSMATTTAEHAIANPTLAGIEKRWEAMPPQEQAELWMQLRDRMKVDWHEMTLQEKKAAYYIAFGPHGPRAETPKGEGLRVFVQVMKYLVISAAFFFTVRAFANPPPRTMTREWQEATNEYAKREKMDPITGISSEGYTGKGHIQSPPAKKEQ